MGWWQGQPAMTDDEIGKIQVLKDRLYQSAGVACDALFEGRRREVLDVRRQS